MLRDCYEIILNHNCDLACGFCSQSDFDPKIKSGLRDAVRHIYRAKNLGYRRLGFSGGEALLRSDLPFLAATARKVGFKIVRLQTNGVRLADPALCRRLAAAGLTVCKFTFPGRSALVHDRLTGVAGSFEKSLRGLDNMLALKLAVGVNIPVTKQNYTSLKADLRFFMDRGTTNFTLIYPIYVGAMRINFRRLGVDMPKAAGPVVEALDFALATGLGAKDIKALNMPPCLLGGHEDNAVDLYKFNTTVASPLGLVWDIDSNVAADKERGPVCAACIFSRRCLGVDRHYLELFGWKGFRPAAKRAGSRRPGPEPGLSAEAGRRPDPSAAAPAKTAYLNSLEKCFMEVLKKRSGIPTAKVLALARGLPLCHDCKDGSSVLTTGETLIKKGLIRRDFRKGKYFWSLVERFQNTIIDHKW